MLNRVIEVGGTARSRVTEVVEGVKNVIEVCAGVRPGERVLIVTDTAFDEAIVDAFVVLLKSLGAEVVVARMLPLKFPFEKGFKGFEEPPGMVQGAMLHADVIFELTTMWCGLAAARFEAVAKGARYFSMVTIAYPNFVRGGALTTDFRVVRPIAESIRDKFTAASSIRILGRGGTDITASLEGRNGRCNDCIATEPGSYDCPADLEAGGAPLEGTAEGVIVVDGMVEFSGLGLVQEPFKIHVRRGKLVDVEARGEGRLHADVLIRAIEACNHPNTREVAEMSLGLNPRAQFSGIEIETEAVIGTAHIAFGSNTGYGGVNPAPGHFDVVFRDATYILDDEVILEDGAPKAFAVPDA
ncbi:MAG: hypothetical protein HYY21_00240 [Candidatus Tectomicrobia bacterium]|nr:hypothetical protein [Candidatus Tectomicrobia bacterium]